MFLDKFWEKSENLNVIALSIRCRSYHDFAGGGIRKAPPPSLKRVNVVENANDDLTGNYAMSLTKVSEKFACKLTQIANLLSFQQEKSLCLFGRSSKKSSKGWNVLK